MATKLRTTMDIMKVLGSDILPNIVEMKAIAPAAISSLFCIRVIDSRLAIISNTDGSAIQNSSPGQANGVGCRKKFLILKYVPL
jgi:hypothetical protein